MSWRFAFVLCSAILIACIWILFFTDISDHVTYKLQGVVPDNTPEAEAVKQLVLFDERINHSDEAYTNIEGVNINGDKYIKFLITSKEDTSFVVGTLTPTQQRRWSMWMMFPWLILIGASVVWIGLLINEDSRQEIWSGG